MRYVAVYERTPSGWSAYVPDLPGCVAAGDTRDETERLTREAVALHIESLRESGDPVPSPGAWTSLVEV
ncbi:MAG: type II toxin-antitoxin system HicB family antitoxin [Dehalococcoidia bacterium]|nr:type II toxin-antitoxin system HicB family antitoxin [Dehalococcoidia bacterium]